MKKITVVLVAVSLLQFGCKKFVTNQNQDDAYWHKGQTQRIPLRPIPRPKFPLTICVNSFDDLVQLFGTTQLVAKSVILANGIILSPGPDLQAITYEALRDNQHNSIFTSRLIVEWRFPGGDWQLSTSDVWSLGCVYQVSGEPPYTNLIKGGLIIQVNTCFYWSTNVYTGERIDYVVL